MFYPFISLIIILISAKFVHFESPQYTCELPKPFKGINTYCHSYTDVCQKIDDVDCQNFISICSQCPPSNITIFAFNYILTTLQVHNKSLENIMKNMNKISNLSIQLNDTKSILKNIINESKKILIIVFVIIFILIIIIVIMVLEIRFKIITKLIHRIKFRNSDFDLLESREKKLNDEIDSILENLIEKIDSKLENLIKKIDSKLENLIEKIDSKLENVKVSLQKIENDLQKFNGDETQITFNVEELQQSIKLRVKVNDSIVKIKRDICDHLKIKDKNEFKRMKLKYNNEVLQDNYFLLSFIDSHNAIIECYLDFTIYIDEIIIIKVDINKKDSIMLQMKLNETISDIIQFLPGINENTNVEFYNNSKKLEGNVTILICELKDNDWLTAIFQKSYQITFKDIFDDNCILTEIFSNTELIANVKEKLKSKVRSETTGFILFFDNKVLEDQKLLYDYEIHTSTINFCNCKKLTSDIEIKKSFANGDISTIYYTNKSDRVMKRYNKKQNTYKRIQEEIKTYQITKLSLSFIKLYGLYFYQDFFYLEIENMTKSSIRDYLNEHYPLQEMEIFHWSKQILEGLLYLHNHKNLHLNLKPSNILLDENNIAKLSSFSLSKYMRYNDEEATTKELFHTRVGTYRYMAPEVLNSEPYGSKADVWSFGASLVEIITNFHPCHNKNDVDAFTDISKTRQIKFNIPKDISKDLLEFINLCLKSHPSERADVQTLLNDNFIKKT